MDDLDLNWQGHRLNVVLYAGIRRTRYYVTNSDPTKWIVCAIYGLDESELVAEFEDPTDAKQFAETTYLLEVSNGT